MIQLTAVLYPLLRIANSQAIAKMTTSLPSSGFSNLFQSRSIDFVDNNVQHGSPAIAANDHASAEWTFRPGVYTPKKFIEEIATLVESVILQLGPDSPGEPDTRSILFDGLRSSLSHEGREATLHLADWRNDEPSQVTQHILKIGKTLYNYALEYSQQVPGNPSLAIYSPCEGHRWVPPAGRLLRSHRSSQNLMMLYNEWLHQITCLRDGLIPFENFEQVQLNLGDPSRRGTRPMEAVRAGFLSHIIRGRLPQEAVVETAKVFTAPSLMLGGYGFQYNHGVVLPASLFSLQKTPFLHFAPISFVDSDYQPAIFETSPPSNEKTLVSQLDQASDLKRADVATNITSVLLSTDAAQSHSLQLVGVVDHSHVFTVDIGKVVHGIEASRHLPTTEADKILGASHRVYDALDVLSSPGVVANDATYPVIVRARNTAERLALLGKLEQVGVYWDGHAESESEPKGKQSALPRFLVVGGK